MKNYKILVEGHVQGVFYRSSTKNKAQELGIRGFAQNKEDGSVYIEAQGEEEDLQKLVEWCKAGPDTAEVERFEFNEGQIKDYNTFEIR